MKVQQDIKDYHKYTDELDLPIFHQSWWLDAVWGINQWTYLTAENNNGHVEAILPIPRKKSALSTLLMPPWTPYLGPYIVNKINGKQVKKYSSYAAILEKLMAQIPKNVYFAQRCLPSVLDVHPWLLNGYQSTTKYTYILENNEIDEVQNLFSSDVRNKIRKNRDQYVIQSPETWKEELSVFYHQFAQEKKIDSPFTSKKLSRLITVSISRNQGKLYTIRKIATDQLVGIQWTVHDQKTSYNMILAIQHDHKSDGIAQKLLWQSISDAMKAGRNYDFEGSMMPNVANIFRRFGATLTPYQKIYKDRNRLSETMRILAGYGD